MLKTGETTEWKGSGFMGTLYFLLIFLEKQNLLKKKKGCLGWPQILGSGHQQHRCPQDSGAHREALVGPRSGLRAAHKRPVGARIPDSGPHGSSLGGGGQRGALWRLSPGQLGVRTVLVKGPGYERRWGERYCCVSYCDYY